MAEHPHLWSNGDADAPVATTQRLICCTACGVSKTPQNENGECLKRVRARPKMIDEYEGSIAERLREIKAGR